MKFQKFFASKGKPELDLQRITFIIYLLIIMEKFGLKI